MDSCPTCGRNDFASEQGIRQHHARTHDEKLGKKTVALNCAHCGDEFEVCDYRSDTAEFCSRECNARGRDRKKYAQITVTCDWCGGEIQRTRSKSERRVGDFCDHECYGKWRSENIVGENHPQWDEGDRNYGPGWNAKKRRKVRERDDKRCCACGMTQEKHLETLGAVLPVHHIVKAKKFDDPHKRNAMDNLITLCRHCHHRWEGIPLRPQR